jgi:hypothetical protein
MVLESGLPLTISIDRHRFANAIQKFEPEIRLEDSSQIFLANWQQSGKGRSCGDQSRCKTRRIAAAGSTPEKFAASHDPAGIPAAAASQSRHTAQTSGLRWGGDSSCAAGLQAAHETTSPAKSREQVVLSAAIIGNGQNFRRTGSPAIQIRNVCKCAGICTGCCGCCQFCFE